MSDSRTPFHDLDDYVGLHRVSGLALSPDGTRLVTTVATLDPKRTKYVTALWELDAVGDGAPRRLTRSAKGESGAAYLPDGSVLFCSSRPDGDDDEEKPQLWVTPTGGGEARVLARRPGGVGGVRVARDSGHVLVASDTFPSSTDVESEEAIRKHRGDLKVNAILHESYPVRYWDHDLGPASPRLFLAEPAAAAGDDVVDLRDLTGDAGLALGDADYDLSPDGSTIITQWSVPEPGGLRQALAVIDVATGERRIVLDDPEREYAAARFSPDGTRVALSVARRSSPQDPGDRTLALLDVATGDMHDLVAGWDHWIAEAPRWLPDGTAFVVTADEDGRSPVFRVDVETGTVQRLTGDAYSYTDLQVSPDGDTVYALRSSWAEPPRPVRLDALASDQDSVPLAGPVDPPVLPGTLVEVETTAADGARVRGWLTLPAGASASDPAPLLLWVHGGPLNSWNAWSWRWNPWIATAQGYAVLLPDPALSTGYGIDFIRRGWGAWGAAPYTDLMAITDEVEARPDIDGTRTAAMGGSFGGYMANWIAGHTDRFRCIVSHAGLWSLEQFGGTTDAAWFWKREMTAEMTKANSPHHHRAAITTPMLVIHGDKDYRVPVGEALRLWAELAADAKQEDGTMPHKFLYFPDENHWILTPQHAKVWYATVLGFADHHVRDRPFETPELLR